MKSCSLNSCLIPFIWAAILLQLSPHGSAQSLSSDLHRQELFPPGMAGIARYRIPGIVVTDKGTILAYCEARRDGSNDWGEIEVHLRRSIDGGKSWLPSQKIAHRSDRIEGNPTKPRGGEKEQTVNNPVAIVDRFTGAIEFLYCVNYSRCFTMRTMDEGATWSDPKEITSTFEPFRDSYDWKVIATGPGHGIQLPSGRLLVPIWLAYGPSGAHHPSAAATIYSDDHGVTWKAGTIAMPDEGDYEDPNESILASTTDGNVLMITRNESVHNRKLLAISPDGATQWSRPEFHQELWEPRCMASLLKHSSGLMLFSNPRTVGRDASGNELPDSRGKRENLTIQLSRDEGVTWPVRKTLEDGPSAYSDLAELPDGSLLCLFERKDSIECARFTLEWIQTP